MKLCSLFACVLLLFTSLACLGQTASAVSGVVSDTDGNPVAGINVTVIQVGCDCMCESPVGQIKGAATTDASGVFRIDAVSLAVQSGDVIVIAHDPGKLSGWSAISTDEGVPLKQSQLTDLKIGVFAITAVSGLVVDTAGRPIEGAQIGFGELASGKAGTSAAGRDNTIAASAISPVASFQPVTSDSAGGFTLEGVPEHVKVQPSAKKPGFVQVPATEGQDAMKIVLLRAGSITGKVVDGKNSPVVGAGVFVWNRGRYSNDSKIKTGSDGSFVTDDLAPASYSVQVTPTDVGNTSFDSPVRVNVLAGKATEAKPIVLPKLVPFAGRIVDSKTSEVRSGLEVMIEGNKVSSAGKSDEQGEFKLWAAPGEVHVRLSMPGANQYPVSPSSPNDSIRVSDSGISGISLTAPSIETATGKVVGPDGKPMAGVVVRMEDYGMTRVTTGSDGKFTAVVPPNPTADDPFFGSRGQKLTMVAYEPDTGLGGKASVGRDELLKNGVVLKLAPTRSISVKVVDGSGSPLEGAEIDAIMSAGNSSYSGDDHIVSGADGQAEVKSLIDGAKYSFSCTKTGFNMRQDKDYGGKVGGKDWLDSITLTMDKSAVAKVHVVDGRGRPVPGAQGGNPSDYNKYPVVADERGDLTVDVPSSADTSMGSEREILITAADLEHDTCGILHASRESLIAGKSTIVLKPKSKLVVHVLDSAGRPLADAQVSMSGAGMATPFTDDSENQLTDKDGNVTLEGLCVGCSYWLSASLKGYANTASPEIPEVGASEWTGQATLTLTTCNRILQGKVVDNHDRPLAGAKVMHQGDTQTSTVTDAGGMFTLKGLPDSDTGIQAISGELMGAAQVNKDEDFITIVVSKLTGRFMPPDEEKE